MALAPAEITAIGVFASAYRSCETSLPSPRCTPPMPPVANTRMPAPAASTAVALTVVAALAARARCTARSVAPALAKLAPSAASRSSVSGSRPTWATPSTIAIVAGVAPPSATASSSACATSRLAG
jgi:hypothetical protein